MIRSIFKRLRTSLLDLVLLLYWYPVRKLIQGLPHGLVFKLTGTITGLAVLISFGVRKQLEAVVPEWFPGARFDREVKEIVRRSIANYTGRLLEEMYLGSITKEQIEKMVTVTGRENLETSVKRGKGTIILLSHFGSFLLPLPAIGFMGYRVSQLAGPPILKGQRPIQERIFKIKRKDLSGLPVTFLRSDIHLKRAVNALKMNDLLAIAFDGREGDKWMEVNFLGRKAFFSPGPIRMAQATGASIVPTFIIRQKDLTHRLIFEKPVVIGEALRNGPVSVSEMQKLADIFSDYFSSYPCHAIIYLLITEHKVAKRVFTRSIFKENHEKAG